MPNEYDKIFKENIEAVILPIADKLLGIDMHQLEEIPDDLQVTLERKPDFTKKALNKDGQPFILHLEFQVDDERSMVFRMQTYKALLQEKYPLPVEQFVVYLGSTPPRMKSRLADVIPCERTNFAFSLVNIRDYSYQALLTSDIPEEITLAILSDFQNEEPATVVRQILQRLVKASTGKRKLQRYIRQLTVLAQLRNLRDETKNQLQTMPITFDITKDSWYLKGKAEGKAQGKAEEGEKVKRNMIISLLRNTTLSVAAIAQAAEVDETYVAELKAKHS
jgi:predicted transposase YdaD